MEDIHGLLRSHRSIRKFYDEPLPDETLVAIVRSGQSAASSSNLQATTVIRVRRPETRARISERSRKDRARQPLRSFRAHSTALRTSSRRARR